MVLREETTIQVKSLVHQMENSLDLNEMEEDIFPAKPPPQVKSKWNVENNNLKRCMGNNLFNSVYKCRFRKVKLMLDKGLNVNILNDYGYNVLIAALHIQDQENRGKMFRFLINRKANPAFRDERHSRSVLAWACILGRSAELQLLLDIFLGEIDILEKDCNGMTPLHHSCQSGNDEIVSILCKECRRYRLSVDVHDKLGLTPYLHAKRLGYHNIAKILQEEGNASLGQTDRFTFRNGDDWIEVGKKAKERQQAKRRMSDFEQAAISGRSRIMNSLQNSQTLSRSVPEIRISCADDTPRRNTFFVAQKPDISKTKSVRYMDDLEQEYMTNCDGGITNRGKLTPPSSLNFRGSLALLDLSANKQFATFKKPPHKKLTNVQQATLANIMAQLADQKTSSYRRGVIVPTPESQKGDGRPKKSTMAIIFGKRKNKKDNSSGCRKSGRKEKEKKTPKDKK
ncbi:uncharacterized protein LOC134725600 [Mytilus trossulus]|uniref:uncharacterized protein LOC134725600 n=1 Tax=Mytilus trossulus TaxID=6551 RepID=UPI0030070094